MLTFLPFGKSLPNRYMPLLILMHDVIILIQNEAMGALPPSLAVAAPIALF